MVLKEQGDIISFGSNSSGRLGLGDNYLEVCSVTCIAVLFGILINHDEIVQSVLTDGRS